MGLKSEVIKANLKDDLWDLDTVISVVEAKKHTRNEKGSTMNMFVLKTDHDRNDNELRTFLDNLKANIGSIADGTRIQLAVQAGEHWYPIDIQVNGGNVSAIIPEAGFSPSTVSATAMIMNQFPEASVYRFYPDRQTVNGKDRTLMIQADGESCSRFALQQLFSLQKDTLIHQKLQQNQEKLATEVLIPNSSKPYTHYALKFSNCPPEIASVFKSAQSLSALDTLDASVKSTVVNEKGETLEQFNARFTRENPEANNRAQNLGIMDFKARHIAETEGYLGKIKDANLTQTLDLKTRGGIDFLTKGDSFRQNYTQNQEDSAVKKAVDQKSARNDVWQQVNVLCRTEVSALQRISAGADEKTQAAIKDYIKKLETVRIDFMETKPIKNQSLNAAYKDNMADLAQVSDDIKTLLKQQGGVASAQDIKNIDHMSQKLKTTVNPPTHHNKLATEVRAAFSSFKDKFQAITSSKNAPKHDVEAEKSNHLTMK